MANRHPCAFPPSGGSAPPPPPPPPRLPNAPTIYPEASQSLSYGYNYGYGYGYGTTSIPQLSTSLAPGQAPRQPHPTELPQVLHGSGVLTLTDTSKAKECIWYCEPCDLELDSQQALKSHRKSHVKCTECPFEGAPKIVKAHFQGSHGKFSGSGFKTVTVAVPGCRVQRFRICVGNRPEDIKRWIEDRKKRFPRRTPKDETPPDKLVEIIPKQSTGIDMLLAGYGSSGSESDADVRKDKESKHVEEKQSPPVEVFTGGTPEEKNRDRPARPCRYFMRNGSCLNGSSCRFSHEIPAQRFGTDQSTTRKRKHGGHTTSDTLLRKLLTNDMERESALTMQLLEFIVDNNFFDKPSA